MTVYLEHLKGRNGQNSAHEDHLKCLVNTTE